MRTQPHIHDVVVTVYRGNRVYRFNLFLKNHRLLPLNHTLSVMMPGLQWRGDIVIMRVGVSKLHVINMRGDDWRVADYAVRR